LTTDPLPAVEQIAIGGPDFGRGYDFSERVRDRGVLGSAELRAKWIGGNSGIIRWAQLYTFADAGHVTNPRTTFATGDLYSAGVGARAALAERLSVDLEAAFPIDAIRFDSGDYSARWSVSVSKQF
jgi:hemolysin activation/secretion protein